MYHNFNAIACKKSIKATFLTALIVLLHTFVNAQMYSAVDPPKRNNDGLTYGSGNNNDGGNSSNWAVALSLGYDVPQGDLSTTFKAAPTYNFSVLNYYGDFTFNATIGYVTYKPKFDTVYYVGNDPTQGYFQYGNYSSLEIYTGAAYNISIADNAKFYFGLDVGSYINFFSFTSNDGEGNISKNSTTNGQQFVAPKIGVDFMVSDNLSVGLEAKYNFLLSGSSETEIGDDYDYSSYSYSAVSYRTFSGHVTLTYHF